MNGHVRVAFLEAVELLDVMQIVPADDDRTLHLCGNHHALQDFAPDADVAREGALLVHIMPLLGLLGRRERQAHVPPIPHRAAGLLAQETLRTDEHRVLLLEGLLRLIHGCPA